MGSAERPGMIHEDDGGRGVIFCRLREEVIRSLDSSYLRAGDLIRAGELPEINLVQGDVANSWIPRLREEESAGRSPA